MATAIVRGYCDEGFVVAADSRESGSDGLLTDFRQKIHQLADLPIVYCMRGSTLLGDRYKPTMAEVLFNFNHEVCSFLNKNDHTAYKSLFSYASAMADQVFSQLQSRSREHSLDYGTSVAGARLPITTIYFDGFWNDVPERLRVCFSHRAYVLEKPTPVAEPVDSVVFDCYPRGSRSDLDAMGLGGLVKLATSHVNRLIASGSDMSIGGKMHLAVIERIGGLKWVEKSPMLKPYPSA